MSLQAALIAALVPYAAIAAAGLRGFHTHRRRLQEVPEDAPSTRRFALGRTPLQVGPVQVQDAIAGALHDLDGLAARHMTRLCVAAAEGLTIRADPLALGEVLTDLIGGAIVRSPCGAVLVSARNHGGRVEIGVINDGEADAADAAASLSSSSREILALHGATLESRAGAHGGIEVLVRLLAPPDRVRPAAQAAPGNPAQGASRNNVVERAVRSSSSSEVGTV